MTMNFANGRWFVSGYAFHQQSGFWYSDVDGSGPYVRRGDDTMQLLAQGGALTTAHSQALQAALTIKSKPGTLYSLTITNTGASAQYYQLHDAIAPPSNGAVPASLLKVAAGATQTFDFGEHGRTFLTGIIVSNSTTAATLTAGANDSWYDAQYL